MSNLTQNISLRCYNDKPVPSQNYFRKLCLVLLMVMNAMKWENILEQFENFPDHKDILTLPYINDK